MKIAILIGFFASSCAASELYCLKQKEITFDKWAGASFALSQDIRHSIILTLPVDCKTLKPLIPKNEKDALMFMDLALPIDLKSSAVQGPGPHAPNASTFTTYGPGVNFSVMFEIGEIWLADGYCKNFSLKHPTLGPAACPLEIYDILRATYSRRAPHDGMSGTISVPPSKKELERRAREQDCGPDSFYPETKRGR